MRTVVRAENPYGHDRWAFAWEKVPAGGHIHLDCGCHDGEFLNALQPKGIGCLVGLDASSDAIAAGRAKYPNLDLRRIKAGEPLPLEDDSMSSVTLMDVLEHVSDQSTLLRELLRVTRPGGVLIVTVPGQNLFSPLDLGNFKFRFPRLHRWWYLRKHSPKEYASRYVANADGLVGDIAAEKAWHEHFSHRKLRSLLERHGWQVREKDGAGCFVRALFLTGTAVSPVRLLRRFNDWLIFQDLRVFGSANVFCVAVKPSAGAGRGD